MGNMIEIKTEKGNVEVSKSVFLFKQLLEHRGIEVKDINQLVFDYSKFIDLWDSFKKMQNQSANETDFEKKLDRHILLHTIKPKTEYAHQQEKRKGKNVLYPIYSFGTNGRLESMAPGGNYPIKDCNIFVKSDKGNYIKIK